MEYARNVNYLDYSIDILDTIQYAINNSTKSGNGWQYIQDNLMLSDVNIKRVRLVEDLCS